MLGKAVAFASLLAIGSFGFLIAICPSTIADPGCDQTSLFVGGAFVFLGALVMAPVLGGAYWWNNRHRIGQADSLLPASFAELAPRTVRFNCQKCGAPIIAYSSSLVKCDYCGETNSVPGFGETYQVVPSASGQLRAEPVIGPGIEPPTAWCSDYMSWLAQRLRSRAYEVISSPTVPGLSYEVQLVASRTGSARNSRSSRFGWSLAAAYLPHPDAASIEEFSAKAGGYAISRYRDKQGGSVGRGCLVVTAVIAEGIDTDTIEWISRVHARPHWAAYVFPVIVSAGDKRIYYCTKRPYWGALYYSQFAKFAELTLRP